MGFKENVIHWQKYQKDRTMILCHVAAGHAVLTVQNILKKLANQYGQKPDNAVATCKLHISNC